MSKAKISRCAVNLCVAYIVDVATAHRESCLSRCSCRTPRAFSAGLHLVFLAAAWLEPDAPSRLAACGWASTRSVALENAKVTLARRKKLAICTSNTTTTQGPMRRFVGEQWCVLRSKTWRSKVSQKPISIQKFHFQPSQAAAMSQESCHRSGYAICLQQCASCHYQWIHRKPCGLSPFRGHTSR